MAHLSRNISDSENPVVSYQPSWFDDGAAAQLHRVSQLRWIDLYIYISIIARRWFGTCVAGSYRWAAGLLENPHHQNRWFSQRYTSILSGDFPSSHVWLRRACLKILGGHPPFPRPCGGRQPIFTKKKKTVRAKLVPGLRVSMRTVTKKHSNPWQTWQTPKCCRGFHGFQCDYSREDFHLEALKMARNIQAPTPPWSRRVPWKMTESLSPASWISHNHSWWS